MEVDMTAVDPERGLAAENIVGHDDDGNPIPPESPHGSDLGQPMDLKNGMFHYRDHMAGPMADILYEPVGLVSDERLLDIYRFQAKRAQGTETEPIIEMAERIEVYVDARGLDKPDLSQWYAAEMTREEVHEVEEHIPEFFTYAQGIADNPEDYSLGNVDADTYEQQPMRVRFCECDVETVVDVTGRDTYPIEGPNAFKDDE